MLSSVALSSKSLDAYTPFLRPQQLEELHQLALQLRDVRVLHLNATSYGGGVTEVLSALVPLMNSLGIKAEWRVIKGSQQFFQVTKALHHRLQGMNVSWSPEMWEVWHHYSQINAELFQGTYDFVVVHDPQPMGILAYLHQRGDQQKEGKWIWRCHLDTTEAHPEVWEHLSPYLEVYDAAIFSLPSFVHPHLQRPRPFIVPPAIDPLSPKNISLPEEEARTFIASFGIDVTRPLITQVSRFDPWKDPLGVIDVYRQVKGLVPSLQLALLGNFAHDDPEGKVLHRQVQEKAQGDPDIFIITDLTHQVGAFQQMSDVILQKSIREGFGLTAAEALWKGTPVVAGKAGGLVLQVIPGQTGYLASSSSECASAVSHLLQNPEEASLLGQQGREHIRENFLITRLLGNYLRLFLDLHQHPPSETPVATEGVSQASARSQS